MSFAVPKDHPRYASLVARHLLEDGVAQGITTPTGLVAHGRGEAFDYLLGERTHAFAMHAIRAAAARLLLARKAVISVNGNTAMLTPMEMIALARESGALLEINIFHDEEGRRERIAERFRHLGADILGVTPDATIPGLSSSRARVDSRGMLDADVVIVSLEDGDRTEALKRGGKIVIAIDLNPMSRTPQMADIAVVDNVTRAFPELTKAVSELRDMPRTELASIAESFDNRASLEHAEHAIRSGTKR